jgi:hypothetical protein
MGFWQVFIADILPYVLVGAGAVVFGGLVLFVNKKVHEKRNALRAAESATSICDMKSGPEKVLDDKYVLENICIKAEVTNKKLEDRLNFKVLPKAYAIDKHDNSKNAEVTISIGKSSVKAGSITALGDMADKALAPLILDSYADSDKDDYPIKIEGIPVKGTIIIEDKASLLLELEKDKNSLKIVDDQLYRICGFGDTGKVDVGISSSASSSREIEK